MNRDLELMYATPGRYAVSFDRLGMSFVMVEVDEQGVCYQLTPKGERDGVLPREGWRAFTRVYITDADHRVFVRIGNPDRRRHER